MKKIRIIVAVIAAALLLMGVGYAAWSQTLTINATGAVDSTDNIRFTAASAVPAAGVTASASISQVSQIPGEVAMLSLGGTVDGKPVGAYPGLTQKYNITLTNAAAFPIDFTGFSSFNITRPAEYDLANYLTFEVWDGATKLGVINAEGSLTFTQPQTLAAGEIKTYTFNMVFANNLPQLKGYSGDGSFQYYLTTNYKQH